jgi:peptidoglycan/xylan/chitin deacetylase (PgdA/CDA1 family)
MSQRTTKLLKAALSALHYTGADGLIAPFTAGNGVVFMLHHVVPEAQRDFDPNRILRVTPEFLEAVIEQVRASGFDFISLDDVPGRLVAGANSRPFAAFTLDDGYRDNRDVAYPIFKRHSVPFTIYVAPEFADGNGDLWWLNLDEALRRLDRVSLEIRGEQKHFSLLYADAKTAAFEEIYWWLRSLPEDDARDITHQLARQSGIDPFALCRELVMNWDELRSLARDPLVTIGAHTCGHYALAKLSCERARAEMLLSAQRISAELGRPCTHFSYPYGCEESAGEREFAMATELGFSTAVTTRKGLLHTTHAAQLTALPRLSLNGDFQDARYVKVLLSGAPFALWNALHRLSHQRTPAPPSLSRAS